MRCAGEGSHAVAQLARVILDAVRVGETVFDSLAERLERRIARLARSVPAVTDTQEKNRQRVVDDRDMNSGGSSLGLWYSLASISVRVSSAGERTGAKDASGRSAYAADAGCGPSAATGAVS